MPATAGSPASKKAKKPENTKFEEAAEAKAENVEKQQETMDPEIDDPSYASPRDPEMKTAELNSAPHPELWPLPDTPEDAETPEGVDTGISVVPANPSVNFEYTIKARGLPVNSGLTVLLEQTDQAETWLTHKSDPMGDAHIVWRTPTAGDVKVQFFTRDAGEKGKAVASHTFSIVDPAKDRRFGEARGNA